MRTEDTMPPYADELHRHYIDVEKALSLIKTCGYDVRLSLFKTKDKYGYSVKKLRDKDFIIRLANLSREYNMSIEKIINPDKILNLPDAIEYLNTAGYAVERRVQPSSFEGEREVLYVVYYVHSGDEIIEMANKMIAYDKKDKEIVRKIKGNS